MAPECRFSSYCVARWILGLALVAVCLFGYVKSPMFKDTPMTESAIPIIAKSSKIKRTSTAESVQHRRKTSIAQSSCPPSPCDCHCSSDPAFSVPKCGEDPDIDDEMNKSVTDLMIEEKGIREKVNNDTLKQKQVSIRDAGKISSNYKTEGEKCRLVTQVCEESRERAEKELTKERKRTEEWKKRARKTGWKKGST